MAYACLAHPQHPIVVADPCPGAVFPADEDAVHMVSPQQRIGVYGADHRSHEHYRVFTGNGCEYGDPLVPGPLVLGAHSQHDVGISVSPVVGKAFRDPLRTLGGDDEGAVLPGAHDVPGLIPPLVGLLDEEVGCHARPDDAVAVGVAAVPVLPHREVELCPGTADGVRVQSPLAVAGEHEAVPASLADAVAAVPGVPGDGIAGDVGDGGRFHMEDMDVRIFDADMGSRGTRSKIVHQHHQDPGGAYALDHHVHDDHDIPERIPVDRIPTLVPRGGG